MLRDLSQHVSAQAHVVARNLNQSYALQFSSAEQARAALDQFKMRGITWQDPRSSASTPLRARMDASPEVRGRQIILGRLWQLVVNRMKELGTWDTKYTMGSNGPKGLLFLAQGDDVEALATLHDGLGDEKYLDMEYVALARHGIDKEKADAFARDALP